MGPVLDPDKIVYIHTSPAREGEDLGSSHRKPCTQQKTAIDSRLGPRPSTLPTVSTIVPLKANRGFVPFQSRQHLHQRIPPWRWERAQEGIIGCGQRARRTRGTFKRRARCPCRPCPWLVEEGDLSDASAEQMCFSCAARLPVCRVFAVA